MVLTSRAPAEITEMDAFARLQHHLLGCIHSRPLKYAKGTVDSFCVSQSTSRVVHSALKIISPILKLVNHSSVFIYFDTRIGSRLKGRFTSTLGNYQF